MRIEYCGVRGVNMEDMMENGEETEEKLGNSNNNNNNKRRRGEIGEETAHISEEGRHSFLVFALFSRSF